MDTLMSLTSAMILERSQAHKYTGWTGMDGFSHSIPRLSSSLSRLPNLRSDFIRNSPILIQTIATGGPMCDISPKITSQSAFTRGDG